MLNERIDAWLRSHEGFVDWLIALTLLLVGLLTYSGRNLVLHMMLTVPLVARRRHPAASAAAVQGAAFVQWLFPGPVMNLLIGDLAVLVAVYSATRFGSLRVGRAALAGGLLGSVLGAVRWPQAPNIDVTDHLLMGSILAVSVVAMWALGRLWGTRHEQLLALSERARLLETERDQRDRLAVSAERARIAREMHDVVAHSLAVIIAQADGGRYVAARSPQTAADTLETIGETGRRALAEMRRLLAVLREGSETDGSAPALSPQLGPQPGAGDLGELVERVRAGGLDVTADVDDETRELEPGLGLAVYRIVQEGLTNVLKHAGPAAHATVRVRRTATDLAVEVLDDGRGAGAVPPAPAGPGHGLMGMRERVATFGGTLSAGPRPGGGFAVRATIPVAQP
ncbi:MAG: hypothetical protein QG622_321 [Actinomycetota bacterium]|nr:hypothetical protein [Actinomycetota bacterium]